MSSLSDTQICPRNRGIKKQGIEQAAITVDFNVITIEPLKIRFLNYRKGFRNVIWKKDE